MLPSPALGAVLVDELVRGGVREAVLSPGSRSAPLAYALHAADRDRRLRLHVRIDERTAAFLALGLARASGRPVPVVTTSGTAAAHLHAAVLEASHSGVPLLALTADRPGELVGTGANQTTEQGGLYGGAVRLAATLASGAGEAATSEDAATWRALTCRALVAAAGALSGDPGPVHLDIALRDPLVGGARDPDPTDLPPGLVGRPEGQPWTAVEPVRAPAASHPVAPGPARTLVVVGDAPPALSAAAHLLAQRQGWPLLAEPSGWGPAALSHGPLLLSAGVADAHPPERVLAVGRATLTRPVQRLLGDPGTAVAVVTAGPRWTDPGRRARTVLPAAWLGGALAAPSGTGDPRWSAAWRDAAVAVAVAVGAEVEASWPSGPAVARELVAALPPGALLVLGSSMAVRDVDAAAVPRSDLTVLANRGLAGIDGTVSTAWGAALAHGGPAYALLGDLTFLHDSTGLLVGPAEPRPDLTLVVLDDDGGGIFTLLEHGEPERAASFERVFGTPTGTDLAAVCAASRTPYVLATAPDELRAALAPSAGSGVRVVHVRVPRDGRRALAARLASAASAALTTRVRPG